MLRFLDRLRVRFPASTKKYTSVIFFLHSLSVYKLALSVFSCHNLPNENFSKLKSFYPYSCLHAEVVQRKNSEPTSHSLVFNNTLFFALCVGICLTYSSHLLPSSNITLQGLIQQGQLTKDSLTGERRGTVVIFMEKMCK